MINLLSWGYEDNFLNSDKIGVRSEGTSYVGCFWNNVLEIFNIYNLKIIF